MTDGELRELVRRVVAERVSVLPAAPGAYVPRAECTAHPSHARLAVLPGVEAGGPCLIEPGVPCNRCGYCQSYGH